MQWIRRRHIIKQQRKVLEQARLEEWHDFFAVWPVKIGMDFNARVPITAWLETVERKLTHINTYFTDEGHMILGFNICEYRLKGD